MRGELVCCILYSCVSGREREGLNGSNGFNCHNRITEINWGLATHLDYRALICTHTHMCSQWNTPHWWNHTGWRLCQVNNKDWSLMLNFLEVPAGLSAPCTCSALQLPPGCTVGWTGISGSISALCLPAGHSNLKHGSEDNRREERPWERRASEIGWIHFLQAMRSSVL